MLYGVQKTFHIFSSDYNDYTCQFTGVRGGKLNAHHIVPFKDILKDFNIHSYEDAMKCEALWDIGNGITMPKEFHIKYHKEFW